MNIEVIQKYYNRAGEKISIIIPCYNREKFIGDCLESIINQTFPIKYTEIIIVDDGSTDNTVKIAEQFESLYPENIIIIKCETNSGGYAGKVRNIGLSYAAGGYITFVDSDDFMTPNALEKLYTSALITDADIVSAGVYICENNTITQKTLKNEILYKTDELTHLKALYMDEGNCGNVWAKLYKHSFLCDNTLSFREDIKIAEDTFFHQQTLLYVKKYYTTDECIYYYRMNPLGLWHGDSTLSEISSCLQVQFDMYEYYKKELIHIIPDELEWLMSCAVYKICQKFNDYEKNDEYEKIKRNIKSQVLEIYPNILQNKYVIKVDKVINALN